MLLNKIKFKMLKLSNQNGQDQIWLNQVNHGKHFSLTFLIFNNQKNLKKNKKNCKIQKSYKLNTVTQSYKKHAKKWKMN